MIDRQLAVEEVRNAPPHDHAVDVYADDLALTEELLRFIEDGLALGECVVVVATSEHLARIAEHRPHPLPVGSAESLVLVDAATALENFMVSGQPDAALFEATCGAVVKRAARGGRAVRVFGEMVAILWANGNVTGALALESLWNEMATRRRFFLLCAYPVQLLDPAPIRAVNAMRHCHSDHSLLGHTMRFAATGPADPSRTSRLLLPTSTAVSVARQIAIRTLVDWNLAHLAANSVSIASELATNAVIHAESAFRLTLSRDATCLRIEIEDAVPCHLQPRRAPALGARSGLALVETIAAHWGCDVAADGKTVWAELRVERRTRRR